MECLTCMCCCCCWFCPVRRCGYRPRENGWNEKTPRTVTQQPEFWRRPFSYEIKRFEMNPMLIFAQTESQRELVEKRVELLKRSFGEFGFEAEVHVDLGPGEMEARLEDFFSREFSSVGAVCVAVIGGTGEAGQLPAGALWCDESRVLDRLTSDLPGALAGRPRIYITEVARTGEAADSGVYSIPITSQYPDVIAIHIPVIIDGESSPLQILCDRLGTERDFKAEVMAAAQEAETAFPALAQRPIQVESTLTLELKLVKRADSLPEKGSSIQINILRVGENGSSVQINNLRDGENGSSVQINNLRDGENGSSVQINNLFDGENGSSEQE